MAAMISASTFMANLYDDVVVFFYRGISFYHHKDAYNFSVMFGKVLNICYQLFVLKLAFKHVTDRAG